LYCNNKKSCKLFKSLDRVNMYRIAFAMLLIAPPAFAATITLPTLAQMDPVGTGCIDGGGYDDPFPSSKGVRAPAFCLNNPCQRALSRDQLGNDILGRPAHNWEWDTYYSRYAEFCRAEAVVPRGGSPVRTAEAFWAPIVAPLLQSYLLAGTVGSMATNGGPVTHSVPSGGISIGGRPILLGGTRPSSGGGSTPQGGGTMHGTGGNIPSGINGSTTPGGGSGTTPGGDGGTTPGGDGGTTPGGDGGGPGVPVVPLPMTGWLLALSLVAMAGLVRRRRETG
jgi:hypothetical protein